MIYYCIIGITFIPHQLSLSNHMFNSDSFGHLLNSQQKLTDLWNCWNRFMGMKVNKLYLVVRIAFPLYFLEMALYSCWWGPWRAYTVLCLALILCGELRVPSELLLGRPLAAEYQPRLKSPCRSCRQRWRTQWSLSIRTAEVQTEFTVYSVFILHRTKRHETWICSFFGFVVLFAYLSTKQTQKYCKWSKGIQNKESLLVIW